MAIDEISESVHRQERPPLKFPPKATANDAGKNVIILGTAAFEASTLLSHVPTFHAPGRRVASRPVTPTPEPLWPPLKSARYCKKLQKRATQSKSLNAASMFLYEGSINHSRVAKALNDIPFADSAALVSDIVIRDSICFWSQQACREFWDEYLKCDLDEALITSCAKEEAKVAPTASLIDTPTCFQRICSNFRRLLKRSVRGSPSFAELEELVLAFYARSKADENFSCGQVIQQEDSFVVVRLITPFHRVWLHAICQFYGFSSHSKTVDNDRLVTVHLRRRDGAAWPDERLIDYLERFHQAF